MRWFPVYAGLRDAIVSHRLAPGTKLPEDELASIYSVSRAVIRAALQALSHDRLARLEPNRGAFVAQPTKQEAREVFEARALIEPKVAALAADAAKPAEIKLLRLHLEQEHEALQAGRDSDAIMLSAKFHIEHRRDRRAFDPDRLRQGSLSRSSLIIALYSAPPRYHLRKPRASRARRRDRKARCEGRVGPHAKPSRRPAVGPRPDIGREEAREPVGHLALTLRPASTRPTPSCEPVVSCLSGGMSLEPVRAFLRNTLPTSK